MNLTDVLSDKPIPARETVVETKVEVDEREGETAVASDDQDKAPEVKTEEKVETKPDADRDDKGRFQRTVPQEALHAERQRRQALEAELAKAREVKPPPSVLEDEDGAFNARIAQATQPLQEKLFRLSVKAARNVPSREDYDDVTQAFLEAADKDPQLLKSFRDAEDPGEYAYSVGKQIKELSDVNGDIVAYGAKKKAEGAAEAEDLKTQLKALQAENALLKGAKDKQDKIPRSLNSEQSAAERGQQFAGPTPLKSIFNS